MRLGGHLFEKYNDADEWIKALKCQGYRAAYCPVDSSADDNTIDSYVKAAAAADIIIAEVGVWNNPLSSDPDERSQALKKCREQLYLADRLGAACCVNIAGSRGSKWDGPHPDDLTGETFDMIVESVRSIIDEVKPSRTFYTLETMPWMYPDSPESYLELIKAVDRKQFAVHLDPVNLVCSPQRYFGNAELTRECFKILGPYIKSIHVKDIILREKLTVHLDEVRPGLGAFDLGALLREVYALNPDIPLMLEHMTQEEDYVLAAEHLRSVDARLASSK